MVRRPWFVAAFVALLGLAIGGVLFAQMESTERGILPLDSSGTLEIGGIHVDVGGKDAQSARFAGWRIAQREGFRRLWAKSHGLPPSQAPSLSDATLDDIVSSIIVQREQIGPNRYIADLGVLFDRARAGQLLGIAGVSERSQPMLLIPVMISGGTETGVELRNPWQRAWAEFRTSQSAVDYVRVSGLGVDPLLINAATASRPGRGWWRNILDLYGAADILVAEVMVHRLYPGGPAKARFIGRHGPDGEIIGGFDLTAPNSAGIPDMMQEGVRRMDELFVAAYHDGRLQRDSSLNLPEPPPPPPEDVQIQHAPTQYQVGVVAPNAATYNSALAHLRAVPGVEKVEQVNIALGNTSYFFITYRGELSTLRSILISRGWGADISGGQLKVYVRPAPSTPAPQPQPQQPAPATNTTTPATQNKTTAAAEVPPPGGAQ
ncbi:MAG TPA: heavy-metal-associated domain-containing protein [Sphingomicrobium sp.]|nr:heavy-metal-associated domain-containing protein [Sphingomicrobium sp.]